MTDGVALLHRCLVKPELRYARRMRRSAGLVLVIATSACGAAQHPKLAMSLPLHRYQLRNGLTAILVPDASATMATMVMRYHVGAVDDPIHEEGVAHLAAHLMYDQRPGDTSLATQLERIAVSIDVEPGPTQTQFFARFAPEHLEPALKLEAVRMQLGCGRIDDDSFTAERSNVASELLTHPSWRLNRIIGEAIYPDGDPMRRAYAADADTVGALTRAQACEFIAKRYAPGNATIVVTGPIDATQFEHALAPLGELAPRAFDRPATMPDRPAGSMRPEVAADVPEQTLAVAFPLPTDVAEQIRAVVLLDRVAEVLNSDKFTDGRHFVLWIPIGTETVDAKLAQLAGALVGSVDALGVHPRQPRTGRARVRQDTDFERPPEEDFERTRARFVAQDLARLDNAMVRVAAIADGTDLDLVLTTHARLDESNLRHTLETALDVSRAKVIVLKPDASRPPTRFAALVEPRHELRRRLELDAASASIRPHTPSSVLGRARTLQLANGMTVVLAPSSTLPIVNAHLVFMAGSAASPLRRTASAAIAALMWDVVHASNERGVQLRWAANWDSVDLSLTGTVPEIDRRLKWFAGLAKAPRGFADEAARSVREAQHSTLAADINAVRDDAFRAHIYGEHPYGAPRGDAAPGRITTTEEAQRFYAQFLQPNNAVLIVTGGFEPDDLMRSVHQAFDSWAGAGHAAALGSPARGNGAVLAMTETSPWIELYLGWLGGPPDTDLPVRQIIAEMIDRLQPRARGSYVSHRFGGHYEIRGTFDPKTATADIVAMRNAISTLADGGDASRQLFAVARRAVAVRNSAGPTSSAGWATALAHAVELGHDLAWQQQLAVRATNVEYDDVKRVVALELNPTAATWLVAGPDAAIRDAYTQLGLTPTSLEAK